MTYYWLNLLKKTLKHEENPEGNKTERFILRERGYYKSWIINNILIFVVFVFYNFILIVIFLVKGMYFFSNFTVFISL